jgi:hypothetical protein
MGNQRRQADIESFGGGCSDGSIAEAAHSCVALKSVSRMAFDRGNFLKDLVGGRHILLGNVRQHVRRCQTRDLLVGVQKYRESFVSIWGITARDIRARISRRAGTTRLTRGGRDDTAASQ